MAAPAEDVLLPRFARGVVLQPRAVVLRIQIQEERARRETLEGESHQSEVIDQRRRRVARIT